MSAPRRWLEDPDAPAVARELIVALQTEPLPRARRERLFRGLVYRSARLVPVWVMLLGAAALAGSFVAWKHSGSLDAETALFDRGVAAQERGRPAEALRFFEEYAARYPHGSLATEAALERIDALVALGRSAEAREEARRLARDGATPPRSPGR